MEDMYVRREGFVPRRPRGCRVAVLAVFAAAAAGGWLWWRGCAARPGPEAPEPPAAEAAEGEPSSEPAPPDPGPALLARALAAEEASDLATARERGFEAAGGTRDPALRRKAEDLLGRVHTVLLLSPRPMAEKTEYAVARGDSLDALAKRFGTTVDLIRRSNGLSGSMIRIGERLRIPQGTFRIEVDKSDNELTVFLDDRFFKRYPVGTGKFESTPTGDSVITDRIAKPTWWRPDGRAIPYGHPDNLLGTHWLSLDIRGYGIHGTWEPETIGGQESQGCIRMYNEDVEELFTFIPVGTRVTIRD